MQFEYFLNSIFFLLSVFWITWKKLLFASKYIYECLRLRFLSSFYFPLLFFYLPDLNHGLKPSLPTSAPILLFFTISHNKFLVSSCLVFRGLKQVQVMSGWSNKIDSKIVFWGTTKGPYLEWNMGWNYAEYKMVAQLLQILLWWSWKIIW